MSAEGRPEHEYRRAQHEGDLIRATARPERECRPAQHDSRPVRAPVHSAVRIPQRAARNAVP